MQEFSYSGSRITDSDKYEDVYLKEYATLPKLLFGLTEYFVFYNTERTHQSPGYDTPDQVYRTGSGGGARIADKFNAIEKTFLEIEEKNRVAPSCCMKKATILNLVYYCFDGGVHCIICKTKSAVYPFISYRININAAKNINTVKNMNKCCLNIAMPRRSHFKVIQPLVLIKFCH